MSDLAAKTAAAHRPLAISLLLGVSGWVAGGFILMLVELILRPHSVGQEILAGAILLVSAWSLFRADGDGEQIFVAQLALALSIAGQCLVLIALTKDARGIGPIANVALLLQIALAFVMPNRLHRTMSTFFALIAWALTVRFGLFSEPEDWYPSSSPQGTSLPATLMGWMLAWCPVATILVLVIRREAMWAGRSWAPALSSAVTGLIAGLAFATLASHPFESFNWFGGEGRNLGYFALWPILSALASLGAMAAAFELRRRGLMAMCVVATLLHVGHFYYALGTSLFVKSLLMLAMGCVCLAGAHALRSKESA